MLAPTAESGLIVFDLIVWFPLRGTIVVGTSLALANWIRVGMHHCESDKHAGAAGNCRSYMVPAHLESDDDH